MVLAVLRRVLPAGLLLASLSWLACSPDSDISGPTTVGEPSLAVTTSSWTTESGHSITMQTLGELVPGGYTIAWGINDDGVVVGYGQAPDGEWTAAFYWTASEGMRKITEGETDWSSTTANDVNNNGVVVGTGRYGTQQVAFRWKKGAAMEPLYPDGSRAMGMVAYRDGTVFGQDYKGGWAAVEWSPTGNNANPAFGTGANIHDANDTGDLVGLSGAGTAVLWQHYPSHEGPEDEIELEKLVDTSVGQAEGVNSLRQIVGYMIGDEMRERAFIWDPVNRTVELDGLGSDYSTMAFDINDSQLIVGESGPLRGDEHAVLWENGANDLPVDLHPQDATVTSSSAQAINEHGLITGYIRAGAVYRAVVWTVGGGGGGESSLTPEMQLDELKFGIDGLEDTGVLNRGQANSMRKKVDNALKKIGQGKTKSAINKLNALINQINAFVRSGNLTPKQAELLLELAQGAIDGLSGD